MKFYLAASFSRQSELRGYAAHLRNAGHDVTSRWLETTAPDDCKSLPGTVEQSAEFAEIDLEDLMAADCCIAFTEPPGSSFGRGGRHVEFGAALATTKRLIVIGHRENVFHCLPRVEFFSDWYDALTMLVSETVSA